MIEERNGLQERDVEKMASVPYGDFSQQFCICYVGRWDSFHGKHPKGVLDGEQFSVEIDTGKHVIKASGSANFPDGFRDFRRWLDTSLQKR